MKKIIVKTYPFTQPRPVHNRVREPNLVVEDATLSIKVLASRYVRGELTGINVHPAEYDTSISPLRSRGIDLSDYSSLVSQNLAEIDALNGDLKAKQEQLRALQETTETNPPGEK